MAKALFGAGCFWGVEERFRSINGVTDVAVGYSGGSRDNPSYEDVCTGTTGHAEVVEVTFDESAVSYEALLGTFWDCHDPTQFNHQGPDVGTQYRTVIFTCDEGQARTAQLSKEQESASGRYGRDIVTEITPATTFWRAEEYHQQYIAKRRGGSGRLFG